MRLLLLKRVLVATEPDDPAHEAVQAAARLATAAGAALHVVSVATAAGSGHAPGRDGIAKVLLDAGVSREDATVHALEGDPALAIGSLADRMSADVIVLGPHRVERSGGRPIAGTALAVVTNASCPCLVVSSLDLRLPLTRVLVPLDLSDTARGALLVGLSWGSALRAREGATESGEVTLTALHVVSGRPADAAATPRAIERELAFARESGGSWAGVSIAGETITSVDVPRGIARYVADHAPDLVVMGTRGLGIDALGRLGSVAASVAVAVEVPTLLVPPAVWITHAGTA